MNSLSLVEKEDASLTNSASLFGCLPQGTDVLWWRIVSIKHYVESRIIFFKEILFSDSLIPSAKNPHTMKCYIKINY